MLLADGKQIASIANGKSIAIQKAPFTADFPMRGNSCFFKKIRTKLNQ
jgi:NAD kinase